MKIVLSLNHFLPDYLAGTEIYTFNLAKELMASGDEVLVVIPNLGSEKTYEYSYENVRVIQYSEASIEDRNMMLGRKLPDGLGKFTSVLLDEKPDLIHFHELAPGRGISIAHVEAAYKMKLPIVLTFHVANYSCNTGNLKYKDDSSCDGEIRIMKCTSCSYHQRGIRGIKEHFLQRSAEALHFLNIDSTRMNSSFGTALGFPFIIEAKKKELLHLESMANKIVVLTEWYKTILELNGISSNKLLHIAQGLPGEETGSVCNHKTTLPLKIVFIGRIDPLKGVHLILKALNDLPSEKIQLDIYGAEQDDDYGKQCRRLSNELLNVKWKGRIESSQVITMLSTYDLLCLPSTFSEMSPLVIQEAFAAGIPVLASDVHGNAEQILSSENGWLFKFKSSEDLKTKLEMLIGEPALIERAKQNLPKIKPFRDVANEYKHLYAQLINQNFIEVAIENRSTL